MSEEKKAQNKQLLVALIANVTEADDLQRAVRKEIIDAILADDPELVAWLRGVLKVYV